MFYYTYNLSWELNFLWVIKYNTTKPKLNTSDLKALLPTILLPFIFIIYGAKNGTVPNIVTSYKDYIDTTLELPTSHNFIDNVLLFIINMLSGFISQWALFIYYNDANDDNIC